MSSGLLQRKCACGSAAGLTDECEECSKNKWLGLQTKLKVNEPGDIYEQEADRVADQVMAAPAPRALSDAPPRIQRYSGQPVRQTDEAPASVDHALTSPGRPLESALRQDMEQRLGHDFTRVRVHSDAAAEQSAREVNADAYTVGHRIVFGAGRFSPGTDEGRRLLAHELTHVVQQSGADEIRASRRDETRDLAPITQRLGPILCRKPTSVTVYLIGPPPPANAAERATPENRRLAELIDALDKLGEAKLIERRSEAVVGAVGPISDDQRRHLHTLEAIEFLTTRRRLSPLKPNWHVYSQSSFTTRRSNVRVQIEKGVRQTGSFKEALETFTHTKEIEDDIEFFKAEADRFKTEFKGQARLTADRMLEGSLIAIRALLHSYGLPFDSARFAAQRLARGSDVQTEAAGVVERAAKSEHVDAPARETHRIDLAEQVERLKEHQKTVAELLIRANKAYMNVPISGEGPAWEAWTKARAELAAARNALKTAWIKAERRHPILAAYRRETELEKVDLGTLDTDPVERQMQAVVERLLPKVADIAKARSLLKNKKDFALTLTPVVALTSANMFIPAGSLRAGVIKDLVKEASDKDSGLLQTVAWALALVTLIPTGGASLAIPAGMAAAGLAVYSVVKEWEKYDTQKTLVNTGLDLARSLSTEEPSLTGFAVSLVNLGFEGLPLIGAFYKARKLKALVSAEETMLAVQELNAIGNAYGAHDLGELALAEAKAAEKRAASTATHHVDDPNAPKASVKGEATKAEAGGAKTTIRPTKTGGDAAVSAKHTTPDGEVVKITKDGEMWVCTNPCERFAQDYRVILERNKNLADELENIRTIADPRTKVTELAALKVKADRAPITDWQYLAMDGSYKFTSGGRVQRGNTLRLTPTQWRDHILKGHVKSTFDASARGASKISTVFKGTPKRYLEMLEKAVKTKPVTRELNLGNGDILLNVEGQEFKLVVDLKEGAITSFFATGRIANKSLFEVIR